MINIRCWKCGGKSSGDTINEARSKLNHAVGLSRGIKCGDNYNCIEEIVDPKALKSESETVPETPAEPVSSEASYKNVEGKSTEHVTFDEAKQSAKKNSKKLSY